MNKLKLGARALLRASMLLLVLVVIVAMASRINPKQATTNLLNANDWTSFPGAQPSGQGGIYFTPVGSVTTHKDTSTPQLNPAVNVYGSHLAVSGDFRIQASVAGVDNGATLQFYGQVPVIYDEWRQEQKSIQIVASGDGLTARIWDGSASTSLDERVFKTPLPNNIDLALTHINNEISIGLNGRTLGVMPDHRIFEDKTIWFGADAWMGSKGWTLTALQVSGLGNGKVQVVSPPAATTRHSQPDALRNLAMSRTRPLRIGAAVSSYPLFTDDQYRQTVIEQFSMVTPENAMKPQSIHPQKNLYTYQDADSIVAMAQQNQMLVHGHALVMPKANPLWMQKTPISQRQQVMVDHISSVVGHFKGKVATWDVVNEPLSEDDIDYTNGMLGLRKQMWLDAMGPDYIDTAFRTAHAADPTAKLYINDYGMEKDGKRWDAILALIQRLQAKGVPIDGVGFEAHIYRAADVINPGTLREHIRTLATLGVASRISEIDVLGDDPAVQASQYADILKVCMSEPTCTSYTTWGVTDLYGSTTLSDRYPTKLGESLLWTNNYKPKPAFTALQQALKPAN